MQKLFWFWLNIFFFALLLGGAFLANAFFRTPSGYAEFENRELRAFPEFSWEQLWEGEFTRGIDAWYSDTTPGRQLLVEANASLQELRGFTDEMESEIILRPAGDADLGLTGDAGSPQEMSEEQKIQARDYLIAFGKAVLTLFTEPEKAFSEGFVAVLPKRKPPPPAVDRNAEGMVGSFLVLGDSSYEIIQYRKVSGTYYAETINQLQDNAGPEVTLYTAIVPSHLHFLDNQRYRSLGAEQKAAIQEIQSQLDPRIKTIDVLSALKPHRDEYLYFRSDHHWTANGAYYAYQQFAKSAGLSPVAKDRFTQRQITGFLGSLFYKTLSNRLRNNPDVVDVYIPEVETSFTIYYPDAEYTRPMLNFERGTEHTNKYLVFINGDDPLGVIRTNADTERKILVFKDSYGNAFIPFLSNHYKEIHILDPRYFQANALSYIKEKGIKEVLVFNYFAIISSHQGFVRNLQRVTQPLLVAADTTESSPPPAEPSPETPTSASSPPEEGPDQNDPKNNDTQDTLPGDSETSAGEGT
jgi:hypothetical protein